MPCEIGPGLLLRYEVLTTLVRIVRIGQREGGMNVNPFASHIL